MRPEVTMHATPDQGGQVHPETPAPVTGRAFVMSAGGRDVTRPETVRVGTLTYRIVTDVDEIKRVSDEADIEPGSQWSAFSDHDRLIIGINPENPADVQRRDVLHEILHCCLRLSGVWPNQYATIVAKAKGRHGGYGVEEFTVAATSAPLLSVLVDNPDLLTWLTSRS